MTTNAITLELEPAAFTTVLVALEEYLVQMELSEDEGSDEMAAAVRAVLAKCVEARDA